jgi:hypothetical protein
MEFVEETSSRTVFEIADLWIGLRQTFATDLLRGQTPRKWFGQITNSIGSGCFQCTDVVALERTSPSFKEMREGMDQRTRRCSFESTGTLPQYFLNAFSIPSGLVFSSAVSFSANASIVFMQTKGKNGVSQFGSPTFQGIVSHLRSTAHRLAFLRERLKT